MSEDSDPLEEIMVEFDKTQEASQKYSEWQKEIKESKQDLARKVTELEEDEEISSTKADAILNKIQNADYGEAREMLKEALEKQGLEFDAEEKNLFADKFTEEYKNLQAMTQKIRNSLVELQVEGMSDEKAVSLLYGENVGNKSDLREVFDVLRRIEKKDFSVDDQARVIHAFSNDLTITSTREILRAIKSRAGDLE